MPEPTLELLTHYRRDLHRIPELDFDLPQTLAYVRAVMEGLPAFELFSPCRSTLCAFLDRGSEHATAFRTDMDALPVTEATGRDFASTHEGRMHACGHDGHMSMVLGLAGWLQDHADQLPRSILLVFQPAEETTGGAHDVCESGVFERHHVDRIFGFHLWPSLPEGRLASRPGPLLAASNETYVTFHGRASHIGRYQEGADAMEAAAHFLCDVYDLMAAQPPEERSLLRFGLMRAGRVLNQVADLAQVNGSLRTYSVTARNQLEREVRELAQRDATAQGCTAEVVYSAGFPPVTNDAALLERAATVLPELTELEEPLMISEDFAWYQQYLPGVFLLLGTGTPAPLHSDRFDFDEKVLLKGVDVYERLALLP